MIEYYVEKTANETGEHVVHSSRCSSLPATETMRYLGPYSNINAPMNEASNWFSKACACTECISA